MQNAFWTIILEVQVPLNAPKMSEKGSPPKLKELGHFKEV